MDVMSPIEMEGSALPGGVSSRCTYAAVLCCICGCRMSSPSPQSTCLACLAQQTDITEGISRSVVLPCCVTCGRYMHTPNRWLSCELESRELMALMLQKIRGLKKVAKVLDSNWIWREPHSRRVSLKLTVQKEILNGRASVQQALLVEGIIQNTQCDDCKKSYTPHAGWTAMVQVRQHADHKRTLLFLEQLVLKHHLASRLLNVIEKPDGLDFCFPSRQVAIQFSAFCESRFPCLSKQSKQLISHDASSNTHFHKYTISVTLAPLCRDDLVYIHRKQAHTQFGGFSSLALCSRVAGAGIQLLDPFTNRTIHVSAEKYWYSPFKPLCTRKHLSSFLVLDVTPVDTPSHRNLNPTDTALPHQQRQQHGEHATHTNMSRRRRRRHQILDDESHFAGETEDDDWDKKQPSLSNVKSRRDHRTAAARRKRHLNGRILSSEQQQGRRQSILSLSSECGVASAFVNGSSLVTGSASSSSDAYSQSVEAKMNTATDVPMQTENIQSKQSQQLVGKIQNASGRMHQVWEVELMRGCDVGVCDRRVITRTHLGGAIQPGDWVQGYDLRSINLAGAVDSQLDEDARSSGSSSSQNKGTSRRMHRHGRVVGTCKQTGGGENNTSETGVCGEDMEVEENIQNDVDLFQRQGDIQMKSQASGKDGEMCMHEESVTKEKEGAEILYLNGSGNDEKEEENALLRCVQFEVIIVKKQPLQRLCAAAEDGKGGGNYSKRSHCKVRPWVLQTLKKERATDMSRRGHEKRNSARRHHDSDAEMEAFKDELEEDPEMRAQVNLWKDPRYCSEGRKEKKIRAQRRMKKMTNKAGSHQEKMSSGKMDDDNSVTGERKPREKDSQKDSVTTGKDKQEKKEKIDADGDTWEDINDSDEESSLEDGESAGVKLAELLEGLTLEDGKLKGVVVQPGGARVSDGEYSATKETQHPEEHEENSDAGEI